MSRFLYFLTLWFGFVPYLQAQEKMSISTAPAQVYIEKMPQQQYIHFDFLINNLTDDTLTLHRVQLTALDNSGNFITSTHLDEVALSPSIFTLPVRVLPPKATITVFNPFYAFDPDLQIGSLQYVFEVSSSANKQDNTRLSVQIQPAYYSPNTALSFPLSGLTLVKDGHDFYAHHRRVDLTHPVASILGIQTNSGLFALDLCPANNKGQLYINTGRKKEDWFGYGTAVKSPGKGKVIAVCDTVTDNEPGSIRLDYSKVNGNLLLLSGNYVLIDHKNGEYSLLAHLQKGSIQVKPGENIKQDQPLGKLGNSGSTLEPHVHYQLMNGPDMNSQPLPIYFKRVRRKAGGKLITLQQAALQTGDLILSGR